MKERNRPILRIATAMTGEDYDMLSQDTPSSRKKVIGLAAAMTIPVMVWFLSGFMLAYNVLDKGLAVSLITATACALLVFLMEKLVVMSKGGVWMGVFRVCVGLVVAMLGSLAIDEVVFDEDIDHAVERLRSEQGIEASATASEDFKRLNGYGELEQRIKTAEERYEAAYEDVIGEANGTKGTLKRGVGDITRFKDKKALDRKSELDGLLRERDRLDATRTKYAESEKTKAMTEFTEKGLLTRIKALAGLIRTDGMMAFTYFLFTCLMLFVEFMVIIFKATWPKTNYERRLEMIEKIGERRMEVLMADQSPLYDPAYSGGEMREVRRITSKSGSLLS